MKKTACAVLLFIMTACLINPLASDARGFGRHGGHWGPRGWWVPWAVVGGAAVLTAPYYYGRYYAPYYDPYYVPPPVVIQEQPPVYVQPAPVAPPATAQGDQNKLFIYPRQGQNEKQQATDRYECHRWAVGQVGYDPTKPSESLTEAQQMQKRADYQRAMGACLDGRGYTMR